jgi:putative spermidine/putrescine transport system substrate-binding protein
MYKAGGSVSLRTRWAALAGAFALFGISASALAQGTAAPAELSVANLGGAIGQSIREVYEPFEKQYNVKIRWATPGSSVENVARVAATRDKPEFDVVFGDTTSHDTGSAQGLWAPIDEKIVTNYKDQLKQARSPRNDVIAYGFNATGLFYANKEFEKRGWKPPTHWSDLLKKEYCGRVGINHPNVSYGVFTLVMLGGGDPAKVPEGIAKLAAVKDCIPVLEPTAAKLEEKVQLGDYIIGVHGSVRIVPLTQKGIPVKFVVPEEGVVVYASVVAIARNSQRQKLAQEFANWILRPDVQVKMMEKAFYGPANSTVKVPKEYADLGVPTREVIEKSVIVPDAVVTENRRNWIRLLDRAMEK